MRIAYFWLTPQGMELAQRLQAGFGGVIEPKEDFAKTVRRDFEQYDALVFIMATGIVVRTIAPLLKSKNVDPAVLVLDQQGRYVISLLSGHLGGANELTRKIAAEIGADPVITTATDIQGAPAFDEIAKKNKLAIENLGALKFISSALLEGKTVELYTEIPLSEPCAHPQLRLTKKPSGKFQVIVSDRIFSENKDVKALYLRPKSLVIGVGCKRNIEPSHLEACFTEFMQGYKLSPLSVAKIATIGLKRDEAAIIKLCKKLKVQLEIVADEEIKSCDYPFSSSEFVRRITGLESVAEACSYLASGCGEMITGKVKYSGVTIAACRLALPPLKL